MQTRSSVLGKRHSPSEVASPTTPSRVSSVNRDANALPTPDPTPNAKRIKLSNTVLDGDNNKENIPPLRVEAINTLAPPTRTARAVRRNSTDQLIPSHRESSLRRYASLSQLPATPSSSLVHLSLATPPPTPPSSLQPISSRVRALLRSTCNANTSISGRETERKTITDFISSFLRAPPSTPDHSILYISGSPGTGKTALVNAMIGEMRDDLSDAAVTVVTVNCMALNSIDALLGRLVEEFAARRTKKGGKIRKAKETTLQTLNSLLRETTRRSLLLLDELDHIASSPSSLTTLFTLVHSHPTILRAIGIANTHTLSTAAAATSMSAMALTGVHTLHFAPYTPRQLLDIVHARLSPLRDVDSEHECRETLSRFLPSPTLALLTKKVASLTGDVRAVLEVLRGAINIALNSAVPVDNSANPLDVSIPSVTPAHVLDALKAYSPASSTPRAIPNPSVSAVATTPKSSHREVIAKIQELGLQPRLALLSGILARKRVDSHLPLSGSSTQLSPSTPRSAKRAQSGSSPSSSAGLDIGMLYTYYKAILSRSEGGVFTPVSRSEFSDLLGMLETVGLVQLSISSSPGTPSKASKRSLSRAVSFGAGATKGSQQVRFVEGVRIEEMCKGLGIDEIPSQDIADVKAEEVRAIWDKEKVRISRESKARPLTSSTTGFDAFEEALED